MIRQIEQEESDMTPKEKIMACIKGRPRDEYVNQFEYLKLVFDPATLFAMGQVQCSRNMYPECFQIHRKNMW